MKKISLLIAVVLFISFPIFSQTWERVYPWIPPPSNYDVRGYYYDSTGGVIITSNLWPVPNGHKIARINTLGDTIWSKCIVLPGSTIDSWAPNTVVKTGKNYLISGYGKFTSFLFDNAFFSVIIDSLGTVLKIDSSRVYHPGAVDIESTITPNKKYCYTNYTNDTTITAVSAPNINYYRRYINKYDSLGNKLWTKKIISKPDSFFMFQNLNATNDNGFIYTKYHQPGQYTTIDSIFKFDGNNNIQWALRTNNLIPTGSIGSTVTQRIICLKDSTYILNIYWADQSIIPSLYKSYVIKLNSQGNLIDSISFNGQIYLQNGIETSNHKLLFQYLDNTSGLYNTGFVFYDKNLTLLSSHPSPLSYKSLYLPNGLISNNLGGAFLSCTYNNSATYAVNFDSSFVTYPNQVTARIVLDNNSNCIQESSDKKIRSSVLKITDAFNNNFYSFSDSSGNYSIHIPNGTYDITHSLTGYKQYECPGTGIITYSTSTTNNFNCTFFDTIIPNITDVNLLLCSDYISSNDTSQIIAFCQNIGTANTNGTFIFKKDSAQTFVSSIPPPISISGNLVTFSITALMPDSIAAIRMWFNTDTTKPVGSSLHMTGLFNISGDVDPSNNADTITGLINMGLNKSYNAKFNTKIVSQPVYISGNKELIYKIKFQNSTDKSIKDVIIIDTINNNLDLSTFKILKNSHPISTTKWSQGNRLTFTLSNINLPSSQINEINSQGEIIYAIKPKNNLPQGTVIKNSANVYFDFTNYQYYSPTINIIGNTQLNGINDLNIENSDIILFPNPANNSVTIKIENGKIFSCEIYDIFGKLCTPKQETVNNIQTSSLNDGVYFVKIYLQNNLPITRKLVVTH